MPEVLSQRGWQGPEGVEPSTANMTLLELAEQLQVPAYYASFHGLNYSIPQERTHIQPPITQPPNSIPHSL